MQRWEYAIFMQAGVHSLNDVQEIMNKWGEDGWELVAVHLAGSPPGKSYTLREYTFKRPLSESAKTVT